MCDNFIDGCFEAFYFTHLKMRRALKQLRFAAHVSRGPWPPLSVPTTHPHASCDGGRSAQLPTRRNNVYFTFFWLYCFPLRATKNNTVYVNQNVCQHKFNMYDSLPASVWSLVVSVCEYEAHIYGKSMRRTHWTTSNAMQNILQRNWMPIRSHTFRSAVDWRNISGRRFGLNREFSFYFRR